MAWNGAGAYVLPPSFSPEVNGTVIDAVRYNGLTSDVAGGITNTISKDGQNIPTANLPMGGFKHTGAAAAMSAGDYIIWGQTFTATLNGHASLDLALTGGTLTGALTILNASPSFTLARTSLGSGQNNISFAGGTGSGSWNILQDTGSDSLLFYSSTLAAVTVSFSLIGDIGIARDASIGRNATVGGQFNGPGTGLTGTASALSIGGNAATATTSSSASTAATVTMSAGRTDSTAYPVLWGTTGATSQLYSATAVNIQSSTGLLSATAFAGDGSALTGTAAGLNIGGSAATAGSATTAGTAGTVTTAAQPSITSLSVGVSDSVNELGYKGLPGASVTTGAFIAGDKGKCVYATGGVTVPNATMASGDCVTILNTTGSPITITATVTTLRQCGTANTGNRTLAGYGLATIIFASGTLAFISGAGVS